MRVKKIAARQSFAYLGNLIVYFQINVSPRNVNNYGINVEYYLRVFIVLIEYLLEFYSVTFSPVMSPQPATAFYKRIEAYDLAEVWQHTETGEHALHAARAFDAFEVITPFSAKTTSAKPTYLTVQTGIDRHITLRPTFLQYVNHSCAPNVFFDTARMLFIALKSIQPGDELVFFYPSTEWDMQQPFSCRCGSRNCLKTIKGAAHLTPTQLKRYRISDFVLEQLNRPVRQNT